MVAQVPADRFTQTKPAGWPAWAGAGRAGPSQRTAPSRAITNMPPAVRSVTGQGRPPRTRGTETTAGCRFAAAACAPG